MLITQGDGACDTHYRVFLFGAWREVPDGAVIHRTEQIWFCRGYSQFIRAGSMEQKSSLSFVAFSPEQARK